MTGLTEDTADTSEGQQGRLAVSDADRDAALCAMYDGLPMDSYTIAVLREVGAPFCHRTDGAPPDRPWDSASQAELRRLAARDWSAKAIAAFLARSEASVVSGLLLIRR